MEEKGKGESGKGKGERGKAKGERGKGKVTAVKVSQCFCIDRNLFCQLMRQQHGISCYVCNNIYVLVMNLWWGRALRCT